MKGLAGDGGAQQSANRGTHREQGTKAQRTPMAVRTMAAATAEARAIAAVYAAVRAEATAAASTTTMTAAETSVEAVVMVTAEAVMAAAMAAAVSTAMAATTAVATAMAKVCDGCFVEGNCVADAAAAAVTAKSTMAVKAVAR